jgi:hypothetical protein
MGLVSKFFCKKETTRQVYIRVLSEHASNIDTLPLDVRDDVIRSELWRGEYLDGVVIMRSDNSDLPKTVSIRHVLPQGRLLLEQLKREEVADSFKGKMGRIGDLMIGFILGIVSAVVGAVIIYLLHIPQ